MIIFYIANDQQSYRILQLHYKLITSLLHQLISSYQCLHLQILTYDTNKMPEISGLINMSISDLGIEACDNFTQNKERLMRNNEERTQPKYQEITHLIHRIRLKFSKMDIFRAIQILYCRLKSSGNVHHQVEIEKYTIHFNHPQFQIRQIISKDNFKTFSKANQQLMTQPHSQSSNKQIVAASKSNKHDSGDNFKRCLIWNVTTPGKTYRLYASKVKPKFNDKEQQKRYYQKRLAAQAFCNRGYGLNKVKDYFYKINGDAYEQGFNFKLPHMLLTIILLLTNLHSQLHQATASRIRKGIRLFQLVFISESLRKLQIFIMERRIRIRSLFIYMLNAKDTIHTDEYLMFCRFTKLTFNLGSVSICEQTTKRLYCNIQFFLYNQISYSLHESSQNKNLMLAQIKEGIQQFDKLEYEYSYQFQ